MSGARPARSACAATHRMEPWQGPSAVTGAEPSLRIRIAELYEKYGHLVYARCRYLLRDEEAARPTADEACCLDDHGQRPGEVARSEQNDAVTRPIVGCFYRAEVGI